MTRWPRALKLVLVWAAFCGAALDLAAPWLVVYVSRDLALVKVLARCLLAPALVAFALVPLWEMWGPQRGIREDRPRSSMGPVDLGDPNDPADSAG